MAHPPAPALVLRDGDEAVLAGWVRSSSVRAGLAQRARIVLLAADGVANVQIAALVGGVRAHGDGLAEPVPGRGAGRAGGP